MPKKEDNKETENKTSGNGPDGDEQGEERSTMQTPIIRISEEGEDGRWGGPPGSAGDGAPEANKNDKDEWADL